MFYKAYDGIGNRLAIGDYVEDHDTQQQFEVREILEDNCVILRDVCNGEYMEPIEASDCRLLTEED